MQGAAVLEAESPSPSLLSCVSLCPQPCDSLPREHSASSIYRLHKSLIYLQLLSPFEHFLLFLKPASLCVSDTFVNYKQYEAFQLEARGHAAQRFQEANVEKVTPDQGECFLCFSCLVYLPPPPQPNPISLILLFSSTPSWPIFLLHRAAALQIRRIAWKNLQPFQLVCDSFKLMGGGALRPLPCNFINQAAIAMTLLWVKGHGSEEKSVYHVRNSCRP